MTTRFASSRLWTIGKRSAQVAGLTVPTAGLGYGTYLYETDPGFHRMVQVNANISRSEVSAEQSRAGVRELS